MTTSNISHLAYSIRILYVCHKKNSIFVNTTAINGIQIEYLGLSMSRVFPL